MILKSDIEASTPGVLEDVELPEEVQAPGKRGRPKGSKDHRDENGNLPPKRQAYVDRKRVAALKDTVASSEMKLLKHQVECQHLAPKWDKNSAQDFQRVVDGYFALCLQDDCRPSITGLCTALHVERSTLRNWALGIAKTKTPEFIQVAQDVYRVLNATLEESMASGSTPAVAGTFLLKNHFGYRDQSDVNVTNEYAIQNADSLIQFANQLAAQRDAIPGEYSEISDDEIDGLLNS